MTENLLLGKVKKDVLKKKPGLLVIGFFDGVHLGHQHIIKRCVDRAVQSGGASMALTFDRPPVNVLAKKVHKQLIIPYREKIGLLDNMGLDYVITAHIDEEFLKLSPAEFCSEILVEILDIRELYVGEGFRFGYGASGNVEFLRKFFKNSTIKINEVTLLKTNSSVISSTIIRESYNAGDIKKVAGMLGRDPGVSGVIVKGAGRGRKLGFPTANIKVDEDFIIPGDGVYFGAVSLDKGKRKLNSVINIGYNPTFEGKEKCIESYILDFNSDIYEQEAIIYFYEKIRDEIRFENEDGLVKQIKEDLGAARRYFGKMA